MKVKTSITLSKELIRYIDEERGGRKNRSLFIEEAIRSYLAGEIRRKRDLKDAQILNQKAKKLNKEARDVLSYQIDI